MCFVCRYAFTPLIDDSDDEETEEFLVSANIGQSHIFVSVCLGVFTVGWFYCTVWELCYMKIVG